VSLSLGVSLREVAGTDSFMAVQDVQFFFIIIIIFCSRYTCGVLYGVE